MKKLIPVGITIVGLIAIAGIISFYQQKEESEQIFAPQKQKETVYIKEIFSGR